MIPPSPTPDSRKHGAVNSILTYLEDKQGGVYYQGNEKFKSAKLSDTRLCHQIIGLFSWNSNCFNLLLSHTSRDIISKVMEIAEGKKLSQSARWLVIDLLEMVSKFFNSWVLAINDEITINEEIRMDKFQSTSITRSMDQIRERGAVFSATDVDSCSLCQRILKLVLCLKALADFLRESVCCGVLLHCKLFIKQWQTNDILLTSHHHRIGKFNLKRQQCMKKLKEQCITIKNNFRVKPLFAGQVQPKYFEQQRTNKQTAVSGKERDDISSRCRFEPVTEQLGQYLNQFCESELELDTNNFNTRDPSAYRLGYCENCCSERAASGEMNSSCHIIGASPQTLDFPESITASIKHQVTEPSEGKKSMSMPDRYATNDKMVANSTHFADQSGSPRPKCDSVVLETRRNKRSFPSAKDGSNIHSLPQMSVGVNRLVRKSHGAISCHSTSNAKDIIELVLKKVTSSEKNSGNLPESVVRDVLPWIPSTNKKNGEEICDSELNHLFITSRNYVPSHFRAWTVAMLRRSPQKQRSQSEQATVPAGNELKSEWNRLVTFSEYDPPAGIYILPLASAGFFLLSGSSENARVQCAFCAVVIAVIKFRSSDAMQVHRLESPGCQFVQGQKVGNIAVAEIAQNAGTQFLSKYPWPSELGQATTGSPTSNIGYSMAPTNHLIEEALVTDSENSAAERPAASSLSRSAYRQTAVLSGIPAHTMPTAGIDSAMSGESTQSSQRQNQQQVVQASSPGHTPPVLTLPGQGRDESRRTAVSEAASAVMMTATVSQSQVPASSSSAGGPSPASVYQTATVLSANHMNSGSSADEGPPQTAVPQTAGQSAQTGGQNERSSQSGQERQLVTYEELGIFAQPPKRPDMAQYQVRLNTFNSNWPHNISHPREEMADAGFYYTGHMDLVRCFHCKGGLKTWERSDKPWIEHSRWFPRCPFIKLCKGTRFVDAVQKLNSQGDRPTITELDVANKMKEMEEEHQRNLGPQPVLLSSLPRARPPANPKLEALSKADLRVDADVQVASMQEIVEQLQEENEQMNSSTLCKVCQVKEVSVLFLPCGHLVACVQCAPALRVCAMCRQTVKGSVRVQMDEVSESEKLREELTSRGGAASNEEGVS